MEDQNSKNINNNNMTKITIEPNYYFEHKKYLSF